MNRHSKQLSTHRGPRAGFTLIELMIVITIIVILASLSLSALVYAHRTAIVTRTKDDLRLIGLALEAYKNDFGDYPRFADPADDQATVNNTGNGTWLDYSSDRGARLLCFALISPGPASAPTGSKLDGQDGADGLGFRVRRAVSGGAAGKVWGPYIDSGKFKLEYSPAKFPNLSDAKILDNNGNPILYFPAAIGPATISANTGTFVDTVDPRAYVQGQTAKPCYNAFDNTQDTTSGAALLTSADMQAIVGKSVAQPFLLWTAGADGKFGLFNGKTDDVCNFDIPPNLKK